MKRFWIAFSSLIFILFLIIAAQAYIWRQFSPETILHNTSVEDQQLLESNAKLWFETYTEAFQGWRVPFSHRLQHSEISKITALDSDYVQIDFRVKPTIANDSWIRAWEALEDENSWYRSQIVLRLQRDQEGKIHVVETMSPVQYQIAHDPKTFEEDSPKSYSMPDRDYTYLFKDNKLYISFDHGKSTSLVPIPYDEIAGKSEGRMDEFIAFNSAVISPEFSAFVGYKEEEAYLFYSVDAGKNWQSSSIAQYSSRSPVSISKNDQGIYVSLPVNRSLGRDYYALFFSRDGANWEKIEGDYPLSFFSSKDVGYLVAHNSEAQLLRTLDRGQTTEVITLPPAAETVRTLGYNPFVQIEEIEEKDGEILILVGQGPEGDYARESRLVKALYRSKDGEHFEFEKEVLEEQREEG